MALGGLLRAAVLSQDDLISVATEWVRVHGSQIATPNQEFDYDSPDEAELRSAWQLVSELPQPAAASFARHLAWHREDDGIPTFDYLRTLPAEVQREFLCREDVTLYQVRSRYAATEGADSPVIRAACIGLRLTDDEFIQVAGRGKHFLYYLVCHAKLTPLQASEAARVLGWEFSPSTYGDDFPIGWKKMSTVIWESLIEHSSYRAAALLHLQCYAIALELVTHAGEERVSERYPREIRERLVEENVFSTAREILRGFQQPGFDGFNPSLRQYLPPVRSVLPRVGSFNEELASQIRSAGLGDLLDFSDIQSQEAVTYGGSLFDPALPTLPEIQAREIHKQLRALRRNHFAFKWLLLPLFGWAFVSAGLDILTGDVEMGLGSVFSMLLSLVVAPWIMVLMYREVLPEVRADMAQLQEKMSRIYQPWTDVEDYVDWLAGELLKVGPEGRRIAELRFHQRPFSNGSLVASLRRRWGNARRDAE